MEKEPNHEDGAAAQTATTKQQDERPLEEEEPPLEEVEEVEPGFGTSSDDDVGFEPLHTEDTVVLKRLASNFTRSQSYIHHTETVSSAIKREMTFSTIPEPTDDIVDPSNPHFNLRKYLRMTMRMLETDSIIPGHAGVLFKNLTVRGSGSAINIQDDLGCYLTSPLRIGSLFRKGSKPQKQILRNFNGLLKSGELLLVLGRPGAGCSTLLKTLTGEMHGLDLDTESTIHYDGISQAKMVREFRGEIVYNQENDKHFPHLTVGQTLEHAAALRVPSRRLEGVSRQQLVEHITQVCMAIFGLTHTYNTKVGNDFVRGVSGGERKRVRLVSISSEHSIHQQC